ncbi:hypothetical protein QTG56_24515 (plasmid) [Rossellomorea sp. AcN35-11]|nr:hypothetical protein [Rossellomorea aquimaris]WJV31799.1 hypothetical protein QTG56_24515 [Rossellomorea sp. AcN35-11]
MMMRKIVDQLTNKELQTCFHELDEWMKTGILKKGGSVRAIHEDIETKLDVEVDLRSVEKEILYIIGERSSSGQSERETNGTNLTPFEEIYQLNNAMREAISTIKGTDAEYFEEAQLDYLIKLSQELIDEATNVKRWFKQD